MMRQRNARGMAIVKSRQEAHLGLGQTEEGIDKAETAHARPEPAGLCAPVESVGVEELHDE